MKTFKIILSCLLCSVMLVSVAACTQENSKDPEKSTTTTTTKKPTSSASTKVESDYEIEDVIDITVSKGTSEADVIAKLPTEVQVLMSGASTAKSETLLEESFDDPAAFGESWTTIGNGNGDVMNLAGGVMSVTKACDYFRTYVNDKDWAKSGSDEIASYAVKAIIKGTADVPNNNFGIIFHATDIAESGPDGYYGMYVGIGDSDGKICIGYADGNWHSIDYVDFDYQPNTDYTLEVITFDGNFVVLLDGQKMYEGVSMYDNGTVGIRTYNQLFEASEFEVRTLGAEDFEHFEEGYTFYESHPVTWSCTDYDPNKTGKYGFIGTVTDLENAKLLVKVTVKENT